MVLAKDTFTLDDFRHQLWELIVLQWHIQETWIFECRLQWGQHL